MQGDPLSIITYGIVILPLTKNIKQDIPDFKHPWYTDDSGALGTFTRLETYLIFWHDRAWDRGITPSQKIVYWSYSQIISRWEKCLEHVTDLGCAWAYVILGVTLVTTSPNAIYFKSVQWRGRRISAPPAKPKENIPKRVMPQWYVRSNQNEYLFKISHWTQETRLREWRRRFTKPFCLVFYSERRKPSPPL